MAKRKPKPEIARKARGRIVLLELSLIGSSDGVPVELTGHGKFDAGAGRLTLEVGIARSFLLFDPTLVAIGLLDVLAFAALAARPELQSDAGSPVYVRSRTDLYDENGREAGGWPVVAVLMRSADQVKVEGQLLDCHQQIEPGERVAAVDAPWKVLAQPIEPEGVLITGAWDARTGRGNSYRGVTTTLLDAVTWAWRDATAARIELVDIEVRRAANATGEMVSMRGGFTHAKPELGIGDR